MKNKILKGILLYSTVIYTLLYLMAICSIIEQMAVFTVIITTIILIILIILCNKYISDEDFDELTFNKFKDNNNHLNFN